MNTMLPAQPGEGGPETEAATFLVVIVKDALGYRASLPDIQEYQAIGATREEAVQGVRELLQTYLEMVRTDQASIPEPHATAEYIRLPLSSNLAEGSSQVGRDNYPTELSPSRCSFCGKQQDQSARFTTGPGGVQICSECVDYCREAVKSGPVDFQQLRQALASREPQAL
jgi:predicted RNase H-like HicB family nuclease